MTFLESLALFFGAALVHDDVACITAGLLVSQGEAHWLGAVVGCFLGTLLMDLVWVLLGAHAGGRLLRRFSWNRTPYFERSKQWIEQRSASVILVTRFLPGIRTPTHVTIGMLGTSIWSLAPYLLLAAILHTTLLVGGLSLLGRSLQPYLSGDGPLRWVVLISLGLLVWLGARTMNHLFVRLWSPKRHSSKTVNESARLDGALVNGD